MTTRPIVSIVVPAFEEEGNIRPLAVRVRACMEELEADYELVFVDDGSRDATWEQIRLTTMHDRRVRGLRLVRNFGHQSALIAGLAQCTGHAAITMDADLQHPPEVIPAMIAAWQDGAPVVLTRRRPASSGGWFKSYTSAGFYRVFSTLTGVLTEPGSSDYRLLDRVVVDQLLAFRSSHGFLRGAVTWLGYPAVTLDYDVGQRATGQTKYSIGRMLRFAMTAIVTFTTRPLFISIWMGMALSLFAFFELAYVMVQYARGGTVPGWASLIGVSSLLFGFLFVMLGIIGLYLAKIHEALQSPPSYLVAEDTSLKPLAKIPANQPR